MLRHTTLHSCELVCFVLDFCFTRQLPRTACDVSLQRMEQCLHTNGRNQRDRKVHLYLPQIIPEGLTPYKASGYLCNGFIQRSTQKGHTKHLWCSAHEVH